jgi:hypothetical protein
VTGPHVLVVAKAPVPGQVKTRLGRDVGLLEAARLAAAALLDTVEMASTAFGPGRCHLALAGELAGAEAEADLRRALAGWTVRPQRGDSFGARLAAAHEDLASAPGVVQIGMDTPHLTAGQLVSVVRGLHGHDAVLAPAEDGGWWALALRDPGRAAPLSGVPMSTDRAGEDTRAALEASGLDVGTGPLARDVDTVADAEVAARLAPGTRFAQAWWALAGEATP